MRTRSSARTKAGTPKSDDDVVVAAPSPAPKEPTPKRRKKSKWDASTVLTHNKSPLADCEIRDILKHPYAWHVLDDAERALILSRFPDDTHILGSGTENARLDLNSLENDNNFRHDCARYGEAISNGWHDEQWLWEAWEAHERRATGEFEEVLQRSFEEEWGVKLEKKGGKTVDEPGDEEGAGKGVGEADKDEGAGNDEGSGKDEEAAKDDESGKEEEPRKKED